MPHTRQQVHEPKITGHVSAQDIFTGLMALKGADQYIKPTTRIPESDRFELHQIVAASSLCGVLREKRRWKAGYAIGIEFVDGWQDFLEVGEVKYFGNAKTWSEFDQFVRSKSLEQHWRQRVDTMNILASAMTSKNRPWKSMIVVYAGRFGDGPRATATNIIYPLPKNTAWPFLQGQLKELGITPALKKMGVIT